MRPPGPPPPPTWEPADERDEMDNNILAAGGILMVLDRAGLNPEVITTEDGTATNQIAVTLHFMKSRYRLTVERIPDEGDDDHPDR